MGMIIFIVWGLFHLFNQIFLFFISCINVFLLLVTYGTIQNNTHVGYNWCGEGCGALCSFSPIMLVVLVVRLNSLLEFLCIFHMKTTLKVISTELGIRLRNFDMIFEHQPNLIVLVFVWATVNSIEYNF